MKTVSYLIALLAAAMFLVAGVHGLVSEAQTGDSKPKGDNQFLGVNVCAMCHIDFARRWANLDHSKKMLKANTAQPGAGCESCHGPGGKHVAGDRKSITSWGSASLAQKSAICLQCHAGKVESQQWNDGPHAKKDLTCTVCHEVHYATKQEKMLRESQNDTCLGCHADLKKAVTDKTHHPLPEDVLTCTSCHNPHGSKNAKLLLEPKAKLCGTCHGTDVPKPDSHKDSEWVQKHGPTAKKDTKQCLMCHDQKDFCNQCHGE